MRSPAGRLGQPIREMLILLPLGLFASAVVFDLIDLATGTGAFAVPAYWMFAGWVLAAAVATPFGIAGWLRIPAGSRARRIAAWQGGGNLLVFLLCGASWLLRDPCGCVPATALALSLTAAIVALVTAWLGSWLVSGGSHDEDAVDALSSLLLDDLPARPSGRVR